MLLIGILICFSDNYHLQIIPLSGLRGSEWRKCVFKWQFDQIRSLVRSMTGTTWQHRHNFFKKFDFYKLAVRDGGLLAFSGSNMRR